LKIFRRNPYLRRISALLSLLSLRSDGRDIIAVREILMFGSIGPGELILIFIIALLVFGPKKLPEIGRTVGKAMREFKKASEEIKGRIEEEIEASEIKDIRKEIQSGAEAFKTEIQRATEDVAKERDVKEIPPSRDAFKGEIEAAAEDLTKDPAKDAKPDKEPENHEIGEGPKVS
jgi:sec-independent protein translocase protein TatA